MRKIVIAIFLFINISDAKNEFIKICENPTSSQFHTLDSIIKKYDGEDKTFKTKVIDRIFEIHGEEKYVIANAFNDGVCEHREDPERFLSGYEYFANTYNL